MLTAKLIKSPALVKSQKSPRGGATTLYDFISGRYVKFAFLSGSVAAFSHAKGLDTAAPMTDLETHI